MRRGLMVAVGMSLGVHVWLAAMLLFVPDPSHTMRLREPYQVDVLPIASAVGSRGAPQRGNAAFHAPLAIPGGAESAQNIDTQNPGERGDGIGDQNAVLLLPSANGIILFDSLLNNLSAAQMQRIRTARDTASVEQRRATPNPRDAVFLASGEGEHPERRPVSASDAANGARIAPEASQVGGLPSVARAGTEASPIANGSRDPGSYETGAAASDEARGNVVESPGAGILGGHGARRSEAANVAFDRPDVDRGPAATPARERDVPRDDTDAESLARAMHASWVGATPRGGPEDGVGRGGVGGGGEPGSGGGRGEGSRAIAYGPGDGAFNALDTGEARYRRWFLLNRRRVYDALRFPERAALEMQQGTTIYDVVILRDGRLASAPRLVRSSGRDDLDRAALAAIRASTPFTPLPDDLAPLQTRVPLRMPIDFSNPMFQ